MHLPHIDEAHIPESKISGYLLAIHHPSGRGKALFFNGLGFRADQPTDLRHALLQHAADNAVSSVERTTFGAKYPIEGRISGPTGISATIRSVWFVESGERKPRFITAYPLRGAQR